MGTKRQRQEYEEFVANEMNTDTLAYILTLALEATQLELKKARKELEELRERRRVAETLGGVDGIIDQSFTRIYRIVAEVPAEHLPPGG